MQILPTNHPAETYVDTPSTPFSGAGEESGFTDLYRRYQAHLQENEPDQSGLSLREQAANAGGAPEAPAQAQDRFVSESDFGSPAANEPQALEPERAPQPEEQRYTPLEQAPETPHSANGVLYEVGEVGFTQQELGELRDALLKEGLPPESLSALEQLASHPHGATLGQVLTLLHGSAFGAPALSDNDKQNLLNFIEKIDGSGKLGKQILALLENGQALDAWNTLREAMSGIEQFTLLKSDAAALGKAFNLSGDTLGKIFAQFGNSDGLLLSPDLFGTLMVPAAQELQNRDSGKNRLAQALGNHLQPLIAKARSRAENERKAANGSDRRAEQSEILIRDKFMDKFHTEIAGVEKSDTRSGAAGKTENTVRTENTPGKAEHSADGKAEHLVAAKAEHFAAGADHAAASGKKASAQDSAVAAGAGEWHKNMRRLREDDPLGNNTRDGGTKRDSAREGMFSRIEVRHSGQTGAASPVFGAQHAPQTGPGAQGAAQAGAPSPGAARALRQVEQGFLSALNNGGRKLELQLTPGDLGGVTLILTSGKGGEISALIRSEKPETTELMARHLDVIRVNLEQQGIRVDKLEVQNQSLNNQEQQQWQGMDQHNAMREEQERRGSLERLRRLGRLVDGEGAPAQDMQNTPHPAEISGNGLHLVA